MNTKPRPELAKPAHNERKNEKKVGKGPIKIWSMAGCLCAECAMKFKWAWLGDEANVNAKAD